MYHGGGILSYVVLLNFKNWINYFSWGMDFLGYIDQQNSKVQNLVLWLHPNLISVIFVTKSTN